MSPGLALGLVALLIAANGLFVAAEFALVAIRRPAVEDAAANGDRAARRVLAELQQLSFVLSAAQFGITVTSLLVGFLAEGAIGDLLVAPAVQAVGLPAETTRVISITGAFVLSTILQMVVGELAPKNLAISAPEPVARAVSLPMRIFGVVFGPVIRIFDWAAAWMTEKVFRVEVTEELAGGHSLEEFGRIVAASTDEGSFTQDQAELVNRALELGEWRVAQILVPFRDVVWLRADDPLPMVRDTSRATGVSRLPVRDGEDVLGTVHVRDLLRIGREDGISEQTPVGEIAEASLVVPESEPLRRLLARFRSSHRTFAVVIDEYGTVVGIVTLEDVLEELVGEIEDEFDPDVSTTVRRIGRGRMRADASLRPDEFEVATGVTVPPGEYETVAGFIMHELGRIPTEGDVVGLGAGELTVTEMDGVRVVEVEARRPDQEPS